MLKVNCAVILLSALVLLGANQANAQNPNMMQMHQQMMMQKLGPADKNYDLRFINMMIMHHQGGVNMAQDALQKAQHPELKQMAQDIITSQTKEIEQMKSWRKQWYGQ